MQWSVRNCTRSLQKHVTALYPGTHDSQNHLGDFTLIELLRREEKLLLQEVLCIFTGISLQAFQK